MEISDNGTIVKSEAMEQYTDKDVTISDGCGAKVIRLHAYKVNADLIATESNAQIAFVNSRWVLSSPDGIKSKLTINSAPQNADALVIGDNSGILGYNLSYNKGTQFTVCE